MSKAHPDRAPQDGGSPRGRCAAIACVGLKQVHYATVFFWLSYRFLGNLAASEIYRIRR
jgi:hypothetical protein